MCGIAGFTQFKRSMGTIDTLKCMGNAIYHRGPDAGGEYLDDLAGLEAVNEGMLQRQQLFHHVFQYSNWNYHHAPSPVL